ncbi:MAG: L,D-transpeptidase [Rhodobacteraceae bacterium]|nr:L,D-transpeptidase [Paracoccaceae bacterium]
MMDRRTFVATGLSAAAVSGLARPAAAITAAEIKLPPAPIPGVNIAPQFYPTVVRVKKDFPAGSIVVVSSQHFLYYIVKPGLAIRYGVAVGKAELVYRGTAVIAVKKEWPTWKPTPEMIQRNPAKYGRWANEAMPGGPGNPLGARAMYLFEGQKDTAVRIHGTIEPNSIGTSVSNGCLRMVNEHVIDLYDRVAIGTPVTVY